MTSAPPRHLVLIPSYNTGARLGDTIAAAREKGLPVCVVIDGSSDNSESLVRGMTAQDTRIMLRVLPRNSGKGAAILHGLRDAIAQGYSHVLTMDADGQHSAAHIPILVGLSVAHPEAMILGVPEFDDSAPRIRVFGHRIANICTHLVCLGTDIEDSLFGFRIYPATALLHAFAATRWMRRFDFDSEAVIRLFWQGVPPINVRTPVRYFRRDAGGISHFNYLRDNLLLGFMYLRLARLWLRPLMLRLSPFRHLSR
jgi:glycosyltransferase involved in cell wall biosynthesis